MKNFLVNIRAYGYHARLEVTCEDSAEAIENSIVDKLGENDIMWERTGMFAPLNRITYELSLIHI